MKHKLILLNNQIQEISEIFVKRYFGEEYIDDIDFVWYRINKPILKDTLVISDYFFSISDVYLSLRYDVREEDLFTRYDEYCWSWGRENYINLYSFLSMNWYFKK